MLLAASAAAAQFLPPPQAPPVLPPTYQQRYPPQATMQQRQFGSRCATQAGICVMQQPGQLGAACFCPTAYGAVYGQVYP